MDTLHIRLIDILVIHSRGSDDLIFFLLCLLAFVFGLHPIPYKVTSYIYIYSLPEIKERLNRVGDKFMRFAQGKS